MLISRYLITTRENTIAATTMTKSNTMIFSSCYVLLALGSLSIGAMARSLLTLRGDQETAVIPAPNSAFQVDQETQDIERTSSASQRQPTMLTLESQQVASRESMASGAPVYVSPFARAESQALNFDHQESSHAPPNYAPRPATLSAPATGASAGADLKTSASYGHHHHGAHHGGYGYDHSGWLDMGAWTGGKGSFGWYADYPVGGKHGYGYGKRR